MMTRKPVVSASLVVALAMSLVGSAGAVSIPIQNHSFESPVVNPNQWLQPPTDWTLVGNYFGAFRGNGEFGQDAAPTDGNQMAFFNVSSADGRQTLTDTYQAGTDYILSIDIAGRQAYGATQDMDLVLYAGGDPNNIVKSRTLTGLDIIGDVFNTYTLTATAADVAAASAAGQAIGIRFAGNGGAAGDFDMDNVRLEAGGPPGFVELQDPFITNAQPAFDLRYLVDNVLDDDTSGSSNDAGNGYATSGANPADAFIDFDFGGMVNVDAFNFFQRGNNDDTVTSFNLRFSQDASFGNADDEVETLTAVDNPVGGVPALQQFTFDRKTGRYVRWEVNTADSGYEGASEMAFLVDQDALLAPVTVYGASVVGQGSQHSGQYVAENLLDGEIGFGNTSNGADTEYSSSNGGSSFVEFDLGTGVEIDGIRFAQRQNSDDWLESFTLTFSPDAVFDGSDRSLVIGALQDPEFNEYLFDVTQSARYVRWEAGPGNSAYRGGAEIAFFAANDLEIIPEPSSFVLVGLGLLGLLVLRRRK